jgi:hypothetical protein
VKKNLIVGYTLQTVGLAIWLYGYLTPGDRSLIGWSDYTPWWIADCLPNFQAEIGMVLMLVGMVPTYWPRSDPLPNPKVRDSAS